MTEQTVKFHLSNVDKKLGVSNRTEAGRWAHLHSLVPASSKTPDRASKTHGGSSGVLANPPGEGAAPPLR